MKILAVAHDVPHPDQSSGELRFFTLLELLAAEHDVSLLAVKRSTAETGDTAVARLERSGLTIAHGPLERLLRTVGFDLVLFEFYFAAAGRIGTVRTWCPHARVVVDTVDVHFHRLRSRARLTGTESDRAAAEEMRKTELEVYGQADLVVTVSDDDRQVLAAEGLQVPVAVLPNIHTMHPLQPRPPHDRLELVFVGSYKWAPNVDAMLYFCHDVMPLVRQRVPQVRLRIVGSAPTAEVLALSAPDVEVVGYVEDTTPYLLSSDISIAPLRYGGGIKGKVGEAMAHGLPVVTTSIGAEGFGFADGRDLLIADSPQAFADAIAGLWTDPVLYDEVRRNGWTQIANRLSMDAVRGMLPAVMAAALRARPKRMPFVTRVRAVAPHYLDKYVLWRFRT